MATKSWIINNLVMDGLTPDAYGVIWSAAVQGWNGSPATRGPSDTTRSNDDGEFEAEQYYNARLLNCTIWGEGPNADAVEEAGSRLGDLLEINQAITVQSGNVARPLNCTGQRTGELLMTYPHKGGIQLAASAVVKCKDPRKYGVLESVSTGLPQSAGLIPPLVTPLVTGTSGGAVVVNNRGKYNTPGVLIFNGPTPGPFRANNVRQGRKIEVEANLGPDDQLVIDLLVGSVVLNGTANRRGLLSSDSRFWKFQKGSTPVTFEASAYDQGTMRIDYAPAWIV